MCGLGVAHPSRTAVNAKERCGALVALIAFGLTTFGLILCSEFSELD
jgi:hypothetical protein